MRARALIVGLGFGALLWLLGPDLLWACPNCKESLFDPGALPQRLSTARGYAWSIGLLLAVPLGLVGGTTAFLIRAHRRRRRAEAPARPN